MTAPVQTGSDNRSSGSSANTDTVALPAPSTPGNTLVVIATSSSSSQFSAADTVADDGANAWSAPIVITDTNSSCAIWTCQNPTAPAQNFTITTDGAGILLARVVEWPGQWTIPTAPSTAIAELYHNGAGSTQNGPPITTIADGAIACAEIYSRGSNVPVIQAPYASIGTNAETSGTIVTGASAYENIATAGTTTNATWSNVSTFKDTLMVGYQLVPAATGGGPETHSGPANAAAITFTLSASGRKLATGSTSSSVAIAISTAATKRAAGSTTSALTFGHALAGLKRASGSASSTLTFGHALAALKRAQGTASALLALATSATGSKHARGTASTTFGFDTSADGDRLGNGVAQAARLAFTSSASGRKLAIGGASSTLVFGHDFAAVKRVQGASVTSLALAVSAAASKRASGASAAVAVVFSLTASGKIVGRVTVRPDDGTTAPDDAGLTTRPSGGITPWP